MFKLQQTTVPTTQKNTKEENIMTNELKEIIHMFLTAAVIAFAIAGVHSALTFESKMEEVRQETIKEAILVSSDEDGYILSFGGELHSYSFN